MPTVLPPHRPSYADPQLRAVGLIAAMMMLVALLAGVLLARAQTRYRMRPRGGELIGATFAPIGAGSIVVDSVRADGPARRGGLRVGDVVEAVGGLRVPSVEAADRALLRPDLDIRVRRGKRDVDLHLEAAGEGAHGQQDPVDRR